MREILFRGKRIDSGKWVEGEMLHDMQDRPHLYWKTPKELPVVFSNHAIVDPATLGQFTGMTDKNDKKIFEGDIVVCRKEICGRWIDCCVEIGFVEMKHGAFGLHRKQGYYRPFKDWLEDYEYEVIGNIHDNPELVEVK